MPTRPPRLVAFDLDGTLIDSRHDIATAANLTLAALGLPVLLPETVAGFIGGGVRNLALRCLTSAADDGARGAAYTSPETFLETFMPIYAEHLLDQTVPYPGVLETLDALRGAGIVTAVVTNKPAAPARRTIEGLDLGPFAIVVGGDSTPARKPDPGPLLGVLAHVGVAAADALYVGDMVVDADTAVAAGVAFVAATWGLGKRSDLELTGAAHFLDRMTDLLPLVGLGPLDRTP